MTDMFDVVSRGLKASKDPNEHLLFESVLRGDLVTLRTLLEGGTCPNSRHGFGYKTPLMSASQWNRGAVELLVSAGSDVALQDAVGNTALHVASLYSKHSVSDGSASIMDILLAAGADPRATNFSGLTPLHIASSPEAIRLLVRAGADPNAVSVEGDNPLHYAVSPANVFALLEAGADPYKRNVQGRTPVEELQLRAACLADWQAPATALEKYLVATSLRSAGITDGKAFEVEAPRIRLRL